MVKLVPATTARRAVCLNGFRRLSASQRKVRIILKFLLLLLVQMKNKLFLFLKRAIVSGLQLGLQRGCGSHLLLSPHLI